MKKCPLCCVDLAQREYEGLKRRVLELEADPERKAAFEAALAALSRQEEDQANDDAGQFIEELILRLIQGRPSIRL